MDFLKFLSPLTSFFRKDAVVDSCTLTANDIRERTFPAFDAAAKALMIFKSEAVRGLEKEFLKNTGAKRQTMLEAMAERFDLGQKLLSAVAEDVQRIYGDHESADSLTYAKATLLRLIQAVEFANSYGKRFLNYVYVSEALALQKDSTEVLLPAEVKYIEENFWQYCLCMQFMAYDLDKLRKALKEMPDAVVTELAEATLPTSVGMGVLDPLAMNGFNVRASPFYLWGMYKAEKQHKKVKAAQEQFQLLQLRLLQLKKLQDKAPDAKLERQISMLQDRIDGLNRDLEDMKADYGY